MIIIEIAVTIALCWVVSKLVWWYCLIHDELQRRHK
jgi:hypothetical protein